MVYTPFLPIIVTNDPSTQRVKLITLKQSIPTSPVERGALAAAAIHLSHDGTRTFIRALLELLVVCALLYELEQVDAKLCVGERERLRVHDNVFGFILLKNANIMPQRKRCVNKHV